MFSLDKETRIKYTTNYCQQENGVIELTSKNIIGILKKIMVEHQWIWHN